MCTSRTLYTVPQLLTLITVTVAHDLRLLVQNFRLGRPHDLCPRRHVDWDIENVVLDYLRTIRQALESRAATTYVQLFVADALGSIQNFILGMDWKSPEKALGEVHLDYTQVFNELQALQSNKNLCYQDASSTPVQGLINTWKTCMC